MSKQSQAIVRCCASCEWIFRRTQRATTECPKCGFASYGAHFVHGAKAYQFEATQEPWMNRKIADRRMELLAEIERDAPKATARRAPLFLNLSDPWES